MTTANLSHEFQQKYEGTCLRVSFDKGLTYTPFWVTGVSIVENTKSDSFVLGLRGLEKTLTRPEVSTHPFNSLVFDYTFPKLGFVNVPEQPLVFVSRKTERQFKRGMCAATTSIQDMNLVLVKSLVLRFQDLLLKYPFPDTDITSIFKAIFEKKYPSLENAMELLRKPHIKFSLGVALSPLWALVASPNPRYEFMVYRETLPVGYYDSNQFHIHQLFYQEMLDFLHRKGLTNVKLAVLK
jgi:hypothetical protein